MERALMVIGVQKEKLKQVGNNGKKLVTWIKANQDKYDRTIAVVKKDLVYDNFNLMGDEIENVEHTYLDYYAHQLIEVPGYDIDCTKLRKDIEYDIIGISTSASVLCIAMSMFSANCRIRVLTEHCIDRKGSKLHNAAITIMKAYMPIAIAKK